MKSVRRQYGMQPELVGEINAENLREAINSGLPASIYQPRIETPTTTPVPQFIVDGTTFSGVKNGAFVIVDNVLGIHMDGMFTPSYKLRTKEEARIRGMIKVRDCVREVFKTQLADEKNDAIMDARHKLNYVYERFVREFGCLSSKENRAAFRGDPDAPLLLSLENSYDEETEYSQESGCV